MYPARDFRSIIQKVSLDETQDSEKAIRAISREPLSELLKYWDHHHRCEYVNDSPIGKKLYSIYYEGIHQATAKERYPLFLFDLVQDYPEFYLAVRDGLIQVWCQLRFSIRSQGKEKSKLYIGSIKGQDIYMPDQDKINLIYPISENSEISLNINRVVQDVKICLSPKAQQIFDRICWFKEKALH